MPLLLSLISTILTLFFQNAATKSILELVQKFADDHTSKGFLVSTSVRNCSTGHEVVAYRSQQLLHPASTQKLLTTGVAMAVLPESFRFETKLAISGQIERGVLKGNVYITGTGDPLLGFQNWPKAASAGSDWKWVHVLKAMGIRQIDGDIVVIDPLFLAYDFPHYWAWNDMGNYYGAVPYAVNFNENQMSVYFKSGNDIGQPAAVQEITPVLKSWKITNLVKVGPAGSGDNVFIFSAPTGEGIVLKGTVPPNQKAFKVKGAIPQSACFVAAKLKEELEKAEVKVDGAAKVEAYAPTNLTLLHTDYSPTLQSMATTCNFKSINIIADALLRAIGQARRGSGTWDNGLEVLLSELEQSGHSAKAMQLKDGSGLSPQATLSASFYTQALTYFSKLPSFERFYQTIPQVGKTGTVSHLGKGSAAVGRVSAKSGSMEGVRTYGGYAKGNNNTLYAFELMVNHAAPEDLPAIRRFMEAYLVKLGDL